MEFDGKEKYAVVDPEQAQELFAEKRREDGFRRFGYEVVRVTWADLFAPERLRARIEAALSRSRSRAG